ncbi:MAG: hypothetical protein ACREOD_06185 [Candidatus Dormibacteria bacterium]
MNWGAALYLFIVALALVWFWVVTANMSKRRRQRREVLRRTLEHLRDAELKE